MPLAVVEPKKDLNAGPDDMLLSKTGSFIDVCCQRGDLHVIMLP